MSWLWWIPIIILFILSFIGIVMPVIPGLPFIWAGILIYYFGIGAITGVSFWVTMIVLSILILFIDFISGSAWVKRYGGSKIGAWAAILGILIGPFIFGPLGVFIGPFILVTIAELLQGYRFKKAVEIGFASFIGLLGGSLVKALFHLIMIGVFLIKVIF